MSWDSSRPIPWKRLGIMLGGYAVLITAVSAFTGTTPVSKTLPGIAVAMVVVGLVMITLLKFGWKMPLLMSRAEQAEIRNQRVAQRQAARAARKGEPVAATIAGAARPRPKPAPTSRTSTGPSQHPRRTSKDRRK